jgi:phospholipid/cholesterol/gamma-HCH transport system permease protein
MDVAREKKSTRYEMSFERSSDETLLIRLVGSWKTKSALPSVDEFQEDLESGTRVRRVIFDAEGLTSWDSGLLTFLIKVIDRCDRNKIAIEKKGLPTGVQRLLSLAAAVPEKKDAQKGTEEERLLSSIGAQALKATQSVGDMLDFIGGTFLAFIKMLGGKARFRRSDLVLLIQECGAQALPIVSLISFLVGLILAFMGAVQLKMFGAQIYVADMVAIAMTREMGAMMTGIIMAGRTGAAFAAQLGTMQVNEEIDALTTMGISPMEYLVLPRMLALIMMMPLLTLYADFVGIIGGAVVGIGMLDLSFTQYFNETQGVLNMAHVATGLFKSVVYGVLIALSGCLQGMLCGRSASAVGNAATSAVVMAIILIIVSDGLFAVISNALGV